MKKLLALGLAVFLGACAQNSDSTGQASNDVTAASTQSVEGCMGNKACIDALVNNAIASSTAVMVSGYEEKGDDNMGAVREIVKSWLAKPNDPGMSIEVTAGAVAGEWNVTVWMFAGHETKEDEGDAEGLHFEFTIKGDAIIETQIKGSYIG